MPLPDLCIAPHEAGELAPGEPLCAPAQYRVRAWRSGWLRTYYVRKIEGWGIETFAAQRAGLKSPTLFSNFFTFEMDSVRSPQKALKQDFNKTLWWRSLFFDEKLNLLHSPLIWKFHLEIAGPRRICWKGISDYERWRVAGFEFTHPAWHRACWETIRVDELKKIIAQELADPDSDCSFALRWIQLSRKEVDELDFPVQKGTREQCDLLLRSIVWSDDSLDQSKIWEWWIDLSTEPSVWNAQNVELKNAGVNHPLNPRYYRLIEIIIRHFGLHLNEAIGKYTVISVSRNYGDGKILLLQVPPYSSQHERLEARLRLRDWLSDKVAPEEIPFLLGETA